MPKQKPPCKGCKHEKLSKRLEPCKSCEKPYEYERAIYQPYQKRKALNFFAGRHRSCGRIEDK